jgi:hypothetical protein
VVGPISDRRKSERAGYKKVSSLVNFPPFFPGIGALYVQTENLPIGPYRAFDRRGRLSSTIYMLPIEDLENRKRFDLEVLAGKGDTTRPPVYQKMYADALLARGFNVHYLLLRSQGDAHDLEREALRVADACASGRSLEQVKRHLKLAKP